MDSIKNPLPPFTASFTPQVPEILYQLNCTIVLSTYQAGKLVFLSAENPDKLVQLSRTFEGAMGIATAKNKLAVACKSEVNIMVNSPAMAKTYPPKQNTYDALYLPQATYLTGQLSLHDMHWKNTELYAINTLFSSVVKIGEDYSFEPIWKPKFISSLAPEDRCHLNGMAVKNNEIEFVTALGETDTFHGWRDKKLSGGVLIHVPSGEIVLRNLAMPHSPRVYNNKVYMLLSAAGELIEADIEKGTYQLINSLGYFVRGMEKFGDYLFIGHSKLRHQTSAFRDLPIAEKSQKAGVIILHLPTGSVVGKIEYENSVDEIYDVKILPGVSRPNIINPSHPSNKLAITTPTDSFWAVEESKK
jgi:uncharacterized protein (TIGR03032 family)